MPRILPSILAAVALTACVTADAQDPAMHQQHMAELGVDGRQLIEFPAPMRQHMLANMRGHLQALSDILAALANDQHAQAAAIANARLGMDSPAAAGCKLEDADDDPKISPLPNMDQHMLQLMPAGMRKFGLAMHQAASDFANEATKAATSGDGKATLAALSRITAQCTACHAAYRVQ
jgi:hypothetical protein